MLIDKKLEFELMGEIPLVSRCPMQLHFWNFNNHVKPSKGPLY